MLFGGEVKVREEKHSFAEVGVFAFDRFLDLEDHVAGGPDLRCVFLDFGTLLRVLIIGDVAAQAGAGLNQHRVTSGYEILHSCWRDRDAVFVVFDFGGNGNPHGVSPVTIELWGIPL